MDLIPPAINIDLELRKLFSIPDSQDVITSIIIGYPKYKSQRGIKRNFKERKMAYMIVRKEQADKIDFDGLKLLDYTSGYNESSSFATIIVPRNVKHKISWSKRSDKYYYVISGEIKFTIDAKTIALRRGDFCIVKKGSKFWYHNESDRDVMLVLIHTPNFDLNEEVYE